MHFTFRPVDINNLAELRFIAETDVTKLLLMTQERRFSRFKII